MREGLPEKITLDRVFERPSEVSQAEIEGGGDDEVSLQKKTVCTNVQNLEFLYSIGVQSPLLGTTGTQEKSGCDE